MGWESVNGWIVAIFIFKRSRNSNLWSKIEIELTALLQLASQSTLDFRSILNEVKVNKCLIHFCTYT